MENLLDLFVECDLFKNWIERMQSVTYFIKDLPRLFTVFVEHFFRSLLQKRPYLVGARQKVHVTSLKLELISIVITFLWLGFMLILLPLFEFHPLWISKFSPLLRGTYSIRSIVRTRFSFAHIDRLLETSPKWEIHLDRTRNNRFIVNIRTNNSEKINEIYFFYLFLT